MDKKRRIIALVKRKLKVDLLQKHIDAKHKTANVFLLISLWNTSKTN
jgi:hypothetical protein